jgi:hypothetical protein
MHDSSKVPALLQYFIFYGIAGLIGHLHGKWLAVPNASNLKKLGDPPRRSFEEAFWQARRNEIVRLAHQHEPTVVPGLIRPGVEDQPILSMPVYLCESRTRRWHSSPAMIVANGRRARAYHKSSGKRVTISPVDQGTLHLTRQRFIFASSMRRREFLLDELTHITATKSGIALATRGGGAISYFRGINATSIRFDVVPGTTDTWPPVQCTFDFTGYEIKEIVYLLLSAPTPAPS